MKRVALYLVAVSVLTFCSISAQAQTISGALLKADIPFDFTVQNVTLEKGTYVIENIGDRAQRVRSAESSSSVLYVTTPMDNPNGDPSRNVLIFHRYGNEYVLAEIWSGENGRLLRKSDREIQLARLSHLKPMTIALAVGR
jgi:hypothetical protein